jgi:MFS family permease
MIAGEAIMAVSLADSLFLSISPDAARTQVILFLAMSMAPFALLAPLIAPFLDKIKGGQRLVVMMVALARAAVMIAMMNYYDSLAIFPLAFGALVLSKTYAISKSALVPTTVKSEKALVEANSRLGQIAGIVGFMAVVPAGIIQFVSTEATLFMSAVVFVVAFFNAIKLPKVRIADKPVEELEWQELHSPEVLRAARTMMILRGTTGFMFFHLAFWLRTEIAGTVWFGVAIGFASLCTLIANFVAPNLRERMKVENMLLLSVALVAVGGLLSGFSGRFFAGILLAGVVNAAAAIGKLAFEATVQSGAPDANRGRAFARFETTNQLAWVLAGLIPVVLTPSGSRGFYMVGIAGVIGCVYFWRAANSEGWKKQRRGSTGSRVSQAINRVRRSR